MLDLPVPLRPMMHTRSPRAICQDTLSNNGIAPKARDTSLNLSRVIRFSKNWARILPDLGLEAAGIFATDMFCWTFEMNLNEATGKAFTGCGQKAKLGAISVGDVGTSPVSSARTSHAQSPFQLFILSASFCHRRSIRPGRGPHHPTSILR